MELQQPMDRPAGQLAAVRNYVDELKQEMRRVTWPTREQVIATTAVVIACVMLFAAYFAVVDQVVARLIAKLFEAFGK